MQNIVTGPVIIVTEPVNGAVLSESLIEVVGTTKNISSINLNNRQIFIDESGAFREKLILSPGYNIITLRAKDKFGIETTEILELVHRF